MKPNLPFEVVVHAAGNLVRTRFFGTVSAAQMEIGVLQFEGLLAEVQEGFTVLADLTELEAMELDCGPHLGRLMELCKARGVSTVIRVIPDPHKDIGLNILSLIHYRGKVKIVTCATLAEAEQALG